MDANLEIGSRRSEDDDQQEFCARIARAISPLSAAPGNARLARECEPYLIGTSQIPRPESTAEYSVTNEVSCG